MRIAEIKQLMLNAEDKLELQRLRTVYGEKIIKGIWKNLTPEEVTKIEEICKKEIPSIDWKELTEEVSNYLATIGIENKKAWMQKWFKRQTGKDLTFKEIYYNQDYDNYWLTLLKILREGLHQSKYTFTEFH